MSSMPTALPVPGDDEHTLGAARRELLRQLLERRGVRDGLGVGPHQPPDREVGQPADIERAADADAALVKRQVENE
jgi:hypothetical protein